MVQLSLHSNVIAPPSILMPKQASQEDMKQSDSLSSKRKSNKKIVTSRFRSKFRTPSVGNYFLRRELGGLYFGNWTSHTVVNRRASMSLLLSSMNPTCMIILISPQTVYLISTWKYLHCIEVKIHRKFYVPKKLVDLF